MSTCGISNISTPLLLGVLFLIFFMVVDKYTNYSEYYSLDNDYGSDIPSTIKSNRETMKTLSRNSSTNIKPSRFYLDENKLYQPFSGTEQSGFDVTAKGGLFSQQNKISKSLNFFGSKEGYMNYQDIGSDGANIRQQNYEDFSGINFSSHLLDNSSVDYISNQSNGCPNCNGGGCTNCNMQPSDIAKNVPEEPGQIFIKMIYTEWCGYSKKAKPDFEKLMNEMNGSVVGNNQIIIEMIDADTEEGKTQAKKYGVKGFPTHLIVKGDNVDKMKSRDYDGMKSEIENL